MRRRHATAKDLLCILKHHSLELIKQLDIPSAQLSFPTDGKGARIKVSLQPDQEKKLPSRITFALEGETLEIPLEVDINYQPYELFRSC